LRLLFIGDSSAAGVGVDWQHEAMPQQAARIVSQSLNRSVCWTLLAKSGVNTRETLTLLEESPPAPADIVICALGVNDVTSQCGARRFVADYRALLHAVQVASGAGKVVINGLPPLGALPAAPQPLRWYLGQYATRLDRALQRFCRSRPETRYVPLSWAKAADMARDRFHPGKEQYRAWAGLVARQVCSLA